MQLTTPGNLGRLIASLGIQLWVFVFLVFFGSEIVHLDPLLRLITQVLFGVPLLIWAGLRLRGPLDRLDLAVLISVAVFAVVCIFSRDWVGSFETLGLVLAYAALFWLLRRLEPGSRLRDALATGTATAMTFSCALNAWLWVNEKLVWVQQTGTPPQFEAFEVFPWETVNVMPILVLLTVPFIAWTPLRPVRTVLWLALGASALVLVPFSVGRAGWLAIALSAVLYVQLRWDLAGRALARVGSRSVRIGLVAAGGLAVLVGAVVVAVPIIHGLSESGRLLIWQESVNMFLDRPLAGNGPGIYSWARLLYPPEGGHLIQVRLTHDAYLQTLADGGLLLAAGFLLTIVTWLLTALRRWRDWAPAEQLAISVLAGLALASALDDFSFLPAVMAMAIAMAAWLAGPPLAATMAASRSGRLAVAPAALALLAVPALLAVTAGDLSRNEALLARTAAEGGDWSTAAAHFAQASQLHPADALYALGLGLSYSSLGADDSARDAYRRALQLNPGEPRAAGGLAALTDDPQQRIQLLQQASANTYGDPQYAYRLGLAEAADGDRSAAATAFAHAVALSPQLFGLLPYDSTGLTPDEVADALGRVLAGEHRAAPILDLIARWDVALAMDRLPVDAGDPWQAVAAELHGDQATADTLLARMRHDDPQDARVYQAWAAIAQMRCDAADEREALRLEALTRGAYGGNPPRVRVARELIYREAGLAASQPPSAEPLPALPRWPWALIPGPPDCGS
ncbi:MAG TPA: O-antigen ligase family protein [Candidatus Limnocylindria bacterium]|jgi:O-antigen ligase